MNLVFCRLERYCKAYVIGSSRAVVSPRKFFFLQRTVPRHAVVTDTLLFLDMVPDALQWDITRSCSKTGRAMVPYLGSSFEKESIDWVSRCFSYALARGGCQHTCSVMVYCTISYVVCYFLMPMNSASLSSALSYCRCFGSRHEVLWRGVGVLKRAFFCCCCDACVLGYLVSYLAPIVVWVSCRLIPYLTPLATIFTQFRGKEFSFPFPRFFPFHCKGLPRAYS